MYTHEIKKNISKTERNVNLYTYLVTLVTLIFYVILFVGRYNIIRTQNIENKSKHLMIHVFHFMIHTT